MNITQLKNNAAAMRATLESIEDDCRVLDRKDMWEEEGECYYEALLDIRDKVSAALAAPARNCDRFATEKEAWKAYNALPRLYRSPAPYVEWLFEPAEGGDHA